MNAFFSGTDNANENMTQFYAVWGRVTNDEPAFIFRWVCGDKKVVCDPDVLIDWPVATYREETIVTKTKSILLSGDLDLIDVEGEQAERVDQEEPLVVERTELVKGPFKRVEYPEDWMAQHSANYSYRSKSTYGGNWQRSAKSNHTGYAHSYFDYTEEDYWGQQGELFLTDEEEMDAWFDSRVPDYAHQSVSNRKVNRAGGISPRVTRTKKNHKARGKK